MCSPVGNWSGWSGVEGFGEGSGKGYWDDQRVNNCSGGGRGKEVGGVVVGVSGGGSLIYNPEWKGMEGSWRWVFFLHNYGFACLFFFLAFYAFFSILNLRSQISTRPYMSTINSFLCLLGVSRAAGLFIDPYGMIHRMPLFVGALVWDLGFPCLISSFSLIQIAFLQLTQMDVGQEKLRKKTCLSVVITLHFVTVIASAIYSTFNPDLMQAKLGTQLVFVIWGLLLCGSFLYSGRDVLGAMGGSNTPAQSSTSAPAPEKGRLMAMGLGMGLLGPGQNIAASLTAALAPTLLQAPTPKIKITDENDRTVSVASDSSRLQDSQEAGGSGRPLTPLPGSSKSKSIVAAGGAESGEQSTTYVRPPSPVLPRRKSSGGNLRGGIITPPNAPQPLSSRRISLNRRGSGYVDEKEASRKKSLTWSENEVKGGGRSGGKGGKNKKSKKGEDIGEERDNNGSDSAGDSASASKRRQSGKSVEPEIVGLGIEAVVADSFLGGVGGPDYTLQSILSHIAYVNQTALDYRLSRKLSRKSQVEKVIKFTWITAMLGVLLCLAETVRLLSPYGLLASSLRPPNLWPWFALHTVARIIEFAMGATVANITKQPVSRPHHYAYSIRHKAQRESLYL